MMIYAKTLSEGLEISLFSILIVFVILGLIALSIQSLKFIQEKPKKTIPLTKEKVTKPFDLSDMKDDDMMVAALVASIDYYEEIKKDVRVISVKEIKTS